MKRIFSCFAASFLLIAGIPVFSVHAEEEQNSKNIRILFTGDISDHAEEWTDTDGTTVGGYAQLKSVIDAQRTENSVLVDAGDFSTGTYYELLNATDSVDMTMLKALGYDCVSLGEGDFSGGVSALTSTLQAGQGPLLLASNMAFGTTDASMELKTAWAGKGASSALVTRGGVKIGIFSITGSDISGGKTGDISFTDEVNASNDMISQLQQRGADVIICLAHTGYDKAKELASNVTGIDVMVAGHVYDTEEKEYTDAHVINHTTVISAGNYGKYLGVLDYDADKKLIVNFSLQKVTMDAGSNPDIAASIDAYRNKVKSIINTESDLNTSTKIANGSYALNGNYTYDDTGSNTADLLTDAYSFAYEYWYTNWYSAWRADRKQRLQEAQEKADAKAAEEAANATEAPTEEGAEATATPEATTDPTVAAIQNEDPYVKSSAIAVTSKALLRGEINSGEIKVSDVFKIVNTGTGLDGSVGESLITVFLTGSDLRNLAEYDALMRADTGDFNNALYFSGLKYDYSVSRSKYNRVEEVYYNAARQYYIPVENDELYPVVMPLSLISTLTEMSEKTDGVLSVVLRNEKGRVLKQYSAMIIQRPDSTQDMKAYEAVTLYIKDFERIDGTPAVTSTYSKARDDSKEDTGFNLIDYFKNTTKEGWKDYGMKAIQIFAIIAICVIIRYIIVRKIRSDNA